ISSSCFFFQAEDGIRDRNVTGVQTCALPISTEMSISPVTMTNVTPQPMIAKGATLTRMSRRLSALRKLGLIAPTIATVRPSRMEIGRASCRERVEKWGVGGG